MRHVLAHRRHRVALRPKVRRRRLRLAAAIAALALLVGAAGLTVRHLWRGLPALPALLARLDLRAGGVSVSGAPDLLAGPLSDYLNDPADSFGARLAALPRRFEAVKNWRLHRGWSGRGARVEVTLRRAVARLQRAGRPAGYLDEDGSAFSAPAELFSGALPTVEAGAADAAQLKDLPATLELLFRGADLPAPARQLSFRSAYEGWELRLQDGTVVLWGDLRWTREKLGRLHEALADSLGQAAAPMLADLRYFEDGRVLLRPATGMGAATR
ncbi:MAG: cell division protein FtsQ/DivIB [Elusimicrobia bacterium]|nr:cell division protein FtsQ/DivIB [Elusimicrobiota bacterium]